MKRGLRSGEGKRWRALSRRLHALRKPSPRWALALLVAAAGCAGGQRGSRPVRLIPPAGYHFDRYPVKPGDSLGRLAEDLGIPEGVLAVVNGLQKRAYLQPGAEIIVPFYNELYPYKSLSRAASSRDDGSITTNVTLSLKGRIGRLLWPVLGGRMTSSFGRRWSSFHEGVDIAATPGNPVFAAHPGTVAYSGDAMRGYGNAVIVEGAGLLTLYAHNDRNLVTKGMRVEVGDPVALVGQTGHATGPHVHFETRVRSGKGSYVAVDPLYFYAPSPNLRVAAPSSSLQPAKSG